MSPVRPFRYELYAYIFKRGNGYDNYGSVRIKEGLTG